ncbi:MAG: ATP-binding protein, partial [Actinobacteria bacterium]
MLQSQHQAFNMQHMTMLRRHLTERVHRLLRSFPVVVIAGPRQVGKSTLAKAVLAERSGSYLSLDDATLLQTALDDPRALVRQGGFTVIDEVQLAPDLLREIKIAVDEGRTPGMFLLTGSANLLKMRSVTESLAGRSAWAELGTFTWSELAGAPAPRTVDVLFAATGDGEEAIGALPAVQAGAADTVRRLAVRGAMPAALALSPADRRDFYDSYRLTFVERDLRQLARVEDLQAFGRVLAMAMGRTSGLVNFSDLAADARVSPPTARSYLDLLETGCQVRTLPAYFVN